ncbi:MAG: response regulator [Rubripirellula sp.]|jgi:CheY-like chemotaxis protein/anti-sigma regulatory factor (Ser/Thr protein kinase)
MPDSSHILIVDDSPTQLRQIQFLLEREGFVVQSAVDGVQALASIKDNMPMLVVTDLQMPEMNGLELVASVKETIPALPVILTTSQGSEEIASQALKAGAASYVPKRELNDTLIPVLQQVMAVNKATKAVPKVAKNAIESNITLEVTNDESQIPDIISRLELPMVELDLFDEGERMQIAMALDEALLNAMIHGNLEVSSELRQSDDGAPYVNMIAKRKQEAPYNDRKVNIKLEASNEQVTFTIRDDGPGFDAAALRDPTDPENIERAGGRGLLLINAFMDEVSHNEVGNEIRMVKRKVTGDGEESDDSDE